MSKFDIVVELMVKNGVTTKFSENIYENLVNNKPIIELDFSEHDKVFEDKIAELEKQTERLKREKQLAYDRSEQLMKTADILNSANKELKQRISELESENKQLKYDIDKMATSKSEWVDKAVEWQQKCEKLESNETSELPFDPLECANYLINATYERETNGIEREFHNFPDKVKSDRYTVDDLEQIAEHLLVYCKHNKESE